MTANYEAIVDTLCAGKRVYDAKGNAYELWELDHDKPGLLDVMSPDLSVDEPQSEPKKEPVTWDDYLAAMKDEPWSEWLTDSAWPLVLRWNPRGKRVECRPPGILRRRGWEYYGNPQGSFVMHKIKDGEEPEPEPRRRVTREEG